MGSNNPSVNQFLWYLRRAKPAGNPPCVLDYAAGGANPPLALFADEGYEVAGIDISQQQVHRAAQYAIENGCVLNIRLGDMRQLPFEDGAFDCVYEWHSMCHLRRRGIELVFSEMVRVLKPGGYLYCEFMLVDSWPREAEPTKADDPSENAAPHTYFAHKEIRQLTSSHPICVVWSQERTTRNPETVQAFSLSDWLAWREKDFPEQDETVWREKFENRVWEFASSELAIICRKI